MSLRDHLQAIYDQVGHLTPAVVVDEARAEDHPLHDRFEWDDKVAGEAHRRSQAHEMIRSVKITYVKGDASPRTVRAFHAVRSEEGHRYEPAEKVAADPFLSRLVLSDMEREWKQLRRRYEEFEEFWTLIRGDAEEKAA